MNNNELYNALSNENPQDYYQYNSNPDPNERQYTKKGNEDLFHVIIRVQSETNEKKKVFLYMLLPLKFLGFENSSS